MTRGAGARRPSWAECRYRGAAGLPIPEQESLGPAREALMSNVEVADPHRLGSRLAVVAGAAPSSSHPRREDNVSDRLARGLRFEAKEAGWAGNGSFAGINVLLVDDDYRNLFAMTALLERGGADVVTAESGREAIDLLLSTPGINLVLMDIM